MWLLINAIKATMLNTTRGLHTAAILARNSTGSSLVSLRFSSDASPPPPPPAPTEPKLRKFKKTSARSFRIYTRTGDSGNTSLFTGERRLKSDAVFEALGTADELSSHLGLCKELASDAGHPYTDLLQRVQCLLQDVSSAIATPNSSARQSHKTRTEFNNEHTQELEECIDAYSTRLPPLENFILPGGGKVSSSLHIARAVCRRAERQVTPLVQSGEMDTEPLKYLNRLSDFLFTIARYATQLDGKEETIYRRPSGAISTPFEITGPEGAWKRKKKEKSESSYDE